MSQSNEQQVTTANDAANYVNGVNLDTLMGTMRIVRQGRADSRHFIPSNRCPNPRAAHQNAPFGLSRQNRRRNPLRYVWKIDWFF